MTATAASAPRGFANQPTLLVLLACLPGGSALVFMFGWGVVLNLAWLMLLAVTLEAGVLKLQRRPVLANLRDCTTLVTAAMLAFALPPTAPWWLGLGGIFVAIVIAKQLDGDRGRKLLNPAMAGYAILLLAFPAEMSRWLLPQGATDALPSFTDALLIFIGNVPDSGIDAFTGATALDSFRHERGGQLVSEFMASSPVMGMWSGLGWEGVNAGFLMGGLYLLYRRIITWHIPAGVLGALAVWAALFHDGGSSASGGSPLFHLFAGATMLGAFFIATDPGTAPVTARSRLLYGALIGSLVYAFRAWSSYPDGVAFAVLIGNLAAPFIDRYMRGEGRQTREHVAPRASPHGVSSGPFVIIVVLAFTFTNMAMNAYIAQRHPDADDATLAAVFPADLHDNALAAASFTLDPAASTFANVELLALSTPRAAYRATLNGQASGVVLPLTAPDGYNGPIELLIGIDAEGTITGVRALQHNETRGLGDGIEPDVSSWILGFNNRSLENTDEVLWAVKKDRGDFDQFVGATITPRATVGAVHNALLFFETNRDLLLNE